MGSRLHHPDDCRESTNGTTNEPARSPALVHLLHPRWTQRDSHGTERHRDRSHDAGPTSVHATSHAMAPVPILGEEMVAPDSATRSNNNLRPSGRAKKPVTVAVSLGFQKKVRTKLAR